MNLINETIQNLTLIHILILSIGSYSITRLITTDGFFLFRKPREWIFKNYPPEGHTSKTPPPRGKYNRQGNLYYVYEGHWLGELVECPWCSGWWVSLVVFSAYVANDSLTLFILIPFMMRAIVGGYANKIGGG